MKKNAYSKWGVKYESYAKEVEDSGRGRKFWGMSSRSVTFSVGIFFHWEMLGRIVR